MYNIYIRSTAVESLGASIVRAALTVPIAVGPTNPDPLNYRPVVFGLGIAINGVDVLRDVAYSLSFESEESISEYGAIGSGDGLYTIKITELDELLRIRRYQKTKQLGYDTLFSRCGTFFTVVDELDVHESEDVIYRTTVRLPLDQLNHPMVHLHELITVMNQDQRDEMELPFVTENFLTIYKEDDGTVSLMYPSMYGAVRHTTNTKNPRIVLGIAVGILSKGMLPYPVANCYRVNTLLDEDYRERPPFRHYDQVVVSRTSRYVFFPAKKDEYNRQIKHNINY